MTAIWDGASTTPAATHRVPVDVSSSGSPTRWTGQQIADLRAYVGGTVNNLGSIGTNQSLSLADGLYIAATITGNVQFTFTSVPTGFTDLFLELTNAGAHTVSFAATIGWTGGTTPSLPAVGVALIHLYTRDGGTSYIAHLVSDEQQFDAAAIVSGTLDAARLPAPGTTTLGGVKRNTGSPGQFVTGIDTDGSLLRDTPAGGSPAGSDTQVQFNDGGTHAGDSDFTFNKTTKAVKLGVNTAISGASGHLIVDYVGYQAIEVGATIVTFHDLWSYGWGDLRVYRDAAGTLAQRNGTNAQTFRVYRSYTDASNYSRWAVKWNTSTAILQAEGAGTGTNGSTAFGNAALATNATVGFLMIPSCAGTPTGTPADIPTGQSPIVYDSTNKKLCVWDGAAWVQTAALT